jgi:hypothetical protein
MNDNDNANGNNGNNDNNMDDLVDLLVDSILASAADIGHFVDRAKCFFLLEATGGDIEEALALYWEDLLASQHHLNHQNNNNNNNHNNNDPEQESSDGSVRADGAMQREHLNHQQDHIHLPAVMELQPCPNNVARRLDAEFEDNEGEPLRMQLQNNVQQEPLDAARNARFLREMDLEERYREDQRIFPDQGQVRDMLVGRRAYNAGAESISVSDDEAGAIWRKTAAALKDSSYTANYDDEDDGSVEPKGRKRRKLNNEKYAADEADDDIDKTGYISENDWLLEQQTSRKSIPLTAPTDTLWGFAASRTDQPSSEETAANNEDESVNASNVILADDDNESDAHATAREFNGIPSTWMSAGFTFSEDGCGLVVQPPNDEDLAYASWQSRVSGTGRSSVSPPYHCRAITALLSLVTAVMHADTSRQQPSLSLDKNDRRRENEARLADALSTLLLIAAKASVSRKRRALCRRPTLRNKEEQKRRAKAYARKLRLCPATTWEEVTENGVARRTDGVNFSTTYTNIEDLRAYVVSNMRSFTSSGGCALFLEAVFRIHGKGAINRLLDRAWRLQGNFSDKPSKCLIDCTCDERHKTILESWTNKERSEVGLMSDTTPPGHQCITIELLSLLITGTVHSSLTGWSTGRLGFGLISDKAGEVGKGLTRPNRPVWILRGPTCYSVIWLSDNQNGVEQLDPSVDKPGAAAFFTHWNCWYDLRNKTDFRFLLHRPRLTALTIKNNKITPSLSKEDDVQEETALKMLKKRRLEHERIDNDISKMEPLDAELVFTAEELERVIANEEDQKFYPHRYTMWRYEMGGDVLDQGEDKKQRAQVWKPYYSLNTREKFLVDLKLGSKMRSMLWTRWPRATLQWINPADSEPIV